MRLFPDRTTTYVMNVTGPSVSTAENKSGVALHASRVFSDSLYAAASDDIKQPKVAIGKKISAFLKRVITRQSSQVHDHAENAGKKGRGIFTKFQQIVSRDRHQWKPEQRFVIAGSEPQIREGGLVNAIDHGVPKTQWYEMAESCDAKFGASLYDQPKALSALNRTSRLDLHGHGGHDNFNGKTPFELASILYKAGLRNVGVIKFQSCDVGKGDYLREFVAELDDLGAKVGYVSGANDVFFDERLAGKVYGKEFTYAPCFYAPRKIIGFLPETFGLVVVKGTLDLHFPNTRYTNASSTPYAPDSTRL